MAENTLWALGDVQDEIANHARYQARLGLAAANEGRLEDSKVHLARSEAGQRGYLLHGTAEVSDFRYLDSLKPGFLTSADHHKLVAWELKEPTLA